MVTQESEKPRSLALLSFDPEDARRRAEGELRDFPELQVTLAPAEGFKGNEGGEIKDIASNGNYTFILREDKQGKTRTIVYDEFGSQLEPEVYIPTSLTLGEFAEKCLEKGINQIYTSSHYSNSDDYYLNVLGNIIPGLSAEERKSLGNVLGDIETRLFDGFYTQDIIKSDETRNKALISLTDARVKTDSSGDFFVLQQDPNTVHVYEVRARKTVLSPGDWSHTVVKRGEVDATVSLPNEIQNEFVLFSDRTQQIPGTHLVAYFKEAGVLSIVDTVGKERLYSRGTRDYSLDPSDNDTLYTIDAEESQTLRLVKASKISSRRWEPQIRKLKDLNGEPEEIRFDPHGNFIVVVSREDDKGWLTIHEKDTLEKVWEMGDVKGSLEVDQHGNIFFADTQDKLRMATTTLTSFPKGINFAQHRAERLRRLRQNLDALTPKRVSELTETIVEKPEAVESEQTTAEIANSEIAAKLDELFGNEIAEADNLQALGVVKRQLETLRNQSEFREFPSSFEPFYKKIQERENSLKIAQMKQLLVQASQVEVEGFEDALSLWEHVREILTIRSGVSISDRSERKKVSESIASITKEAENYLKEHQEAFLERVEEQFGVVSELASSSYSEQELDELRRQQEATVLGGWIDRIPDADKRGELRDRLKDLFESRSEQIKQRRQQTEAERYMRIAESIEEIKGNISDLSGLFSEVSSPTEFDSLARNNPQVIALRGQILSLPNDLRREQQKKLDELMRANRQSLASRRRLGIVSAESPEAIQFGSETFPIFHLPPDFDRSVKREVPQFNPKWVLSDYYIEKLADIVSVLKTQMVNQESVLILEGEAGTGKNVLLEMLAHYSNRELFNFACTGQTVREDLFYDHRFDPKEGTYRVDSILVEGIERPGAIVNVDEISKLGEKTVGLLNPLFDHRREISSPELKLRSKAKPTVLLTATMNPRHYLGANQLPQDALSRAVIIPVDYPPEMDGARVRPDEPMIYSKYLPNLMDFSKEEFESVWDYIINGDLGSGGDRYVTPQVEQEVLDIRMLTKVANKVRAAREAFLTMQSFDSVELVFSIREGIQIVSALRRYPDVKDAIKGVVLPKIADPIEKKRVELLIDQT